MHLSWFDLHHTELSAAQLYQLLALRNAVFIVEQQCAYQDIDGEDLSGDTRHIIAMADHRLLAYARILVPATEHHVKIGRVIVEASGRGQGLGQQLMTHVLRSCQQHWSERRITLSAQAHLQSFYTDFGFSSIGEIYPEDGIPHIDMQR
ncbi:MAG: hypothetical protein XXXJIFNMEKO3_01835 [Candidatus Erwinia impunctatus]|nr:hypothetical protein XXXJIFNMEKO_01835 [Culicoides impunctatus]